MLDLAMFQSLVVSHIWQSLLLAALLAGALILGRRMAGRTRYMLAVAALAASVILPAAAFLPKQALVDNLLTAIGAPVSATSGEIITVAETEAAAAENPASLSMAIIAALLKPSEDASVAATIPAPETVAREPAFVLPDLTAPFLAVWALVALVLLARTVRDLAAVERMVGRARQVVLPSGLANRLRGVRVAVSPEAPGPMAAGLVRPCIILPDHMASDIDSTELAALLEHERAHIERRDMLAALGQRVLTALLWWSPAVHWISRRMDEEREVACDETAVARTGDARAFALSLTSQAENQLWARAPRLAVGAIGPRSHLGRRVRRLVDMAKSGMSSSRYAGRVAFSALLLCAGVAVVVTPQLAADTPPDAEATLDGGARYAPRAEGFYRAQYAPQPAPLAPLSPPAPLSPEAPLAPLAPRAPLSPLDHEFEAELSGLLAEILAEVDIAMAGIGPELDAEMAGLDSELATLGLEIAALVNQEVMSELPGIMHDVRIALQDTDFRDHFDSEEFRQEMEDLRIELRDSLGPEFRQELRDAMQEAREEIMAHREEIRDSIRDIDMDEVRRALDEAREEIRAARERGEIPSDFEFEHELEAILEDINHEADTTRKNHRWTWSSSTSN
jgi:beta-lactamase regulating signal transducer with metallopeptidase domain